MAGCRFYESGLVIALLSDRNLGDASPLQKVTSGCICMPLGMAAMDKTSVDLHGLLGLISSNASPVRPVQSFELGCATPDVMRGIRSTACVYAVRACVWLRVWV